MKKFKVVFGALLLTTVALVLSGCFAHVRTVDAEKDTHYDERYDYVDLKKLTERMSSAILANPPISKRTEAPVMIIYGISNRTSEHIDTKALTDSVRTKLIHSGKIKFVNESQRKNIDKEIEQMQGRTTPETQIKLGSQVGAQYMLTGTLSSIEKEQPKQVRLHRKTLMYYKLTMEITNIKTALIEWTDEQEIVREAERPFIGW